MFKRRNPLSYAQAIGHAFYPRGGWGRATRYIAHRVRRLPDPAHKISRGIAAGVFVSFSPFFGFHFVLAAALAWALRGNILAAVLATFFGNPVTFPAIATISVELGTWLLGRGHIPAHDIMSAFSYASVELWTNLTAFITGAVVSWDRTGAFFARVFLPYLIGSIGPGLATSIAAYWLSYPIILSYQRGRIAQVKARFEARRRAAEQVRAARIAAAEAAHQAASQAAAIEGGTDDR